MFRALVALTLVTSTLAWGDAEPRFSKVKDEAEAIGGLGAFLDKYVGDCGTDLECKKNTETFRAAANGKKFYMIVSEESVTNLTMGGYDPGSQTFTLNLTPFFPASNSAVTGGAPSRTDSSGNPVMAFMAIKGATTEGRSETSIARAVAMKVLRLQVVFTPQGLWSLPKKGGGKIVGVKSHIDAVLVTVGRTGETVGLYLAK